MNNNIAELPDFPLLRKLAATLWQQDNSYNGAAILVGAGFSRIAASSGDATKRMPLWKDFSQLLTAEIVPDGPIKPQGAVDPLRLSEEFRAYFGQQALLDLIKVAVHDEAWMPGDLHKELLKLPWSEVLTTNWDTLLERASVEIHQPVYSIVNQQANLSSAHSPRIVKLHGTIGITDELIFTLEDFRKYPQNYAAFVNFARQVFIENELCLLGFSGDDPNFLQWAGWVRDHLVNHARRIYLVGALNLSPARRKYLESINVAVIDLSPLVVEHDDPDIKHKAATEIFIEALRGFKPKPVWEWEPTQLHLPLQTVEEDDRARKDAIFAAKLLEEQIESLERDRLNYPGWFICPTSLLWRLNTQINDLHPTAENLAVMTSGSRAKLLYEMVWRLRVTYDTTLSWSWLRQELLAICDPDIPCSITKKQQLEIAIFLLNDSRWLDESEALLIVEKTSSILQKNTKYWPESANELTYYRAIISRDQFDYPAMENAIENLDDSDFIWKLKKASLLVELGRFAEGENLIADTYRELLNQNRKERNSIRVFSRLAWAHWLMHGITLWTPAKDEVKELPSIYHDLKCAPWEQIEYIRNRISKFLEKQREQQGLEPLFEPGHYKDNSKTVIISNELHPFLFIDGVTRIVGLPLRWKYVNFLADSAAKLAEFDDLDGLPLFTFAIRSATTETADSLKTVFSRVRIARLPTESVDWLLRSCEAALDYWSNKLTGGSVDDVQDYARERLRVFLEVLARVLVRVPPEQAKRILQKGLELGRIPEAQHVWLSSALRDLLENAIKSIPKMHQHEVLINVLSFPLKAETKLATHPSEWPNPIINFPGGRNANSILDYRINEIINQIVPCSPKSMPAIQRLLPLLDADFLTATERQKIGEKIWGSNPAYQTLPITGLLPHALFVLPAPDISAARNTLRNYFFEAHEDHLFNSFLLQGITGAASMNVVGGLPSAEQALCYFHRLVSWRVKESNNDPFGFLDQEMVRLSDSISKVLAYAIVPALPIEALEQKNFELLLAFHSASDASDSVIALSRFAAYNEEFSGLVGKIIRQGLQGQKSNQVASAAFALLKWREIKASSITDKLISHLVYLLGANLGEGLSALLWTVRQMYIKGYLADDDVESLIESVPLVFDSADYQNISPAQREAISVSLVRSECFRLAKAVLVNSCSQNSELLRIVEEAKCDPLPEVRFAEYDDK